MCAIVLSAAVGVILQWSPAAAEATVDYCFNHWPPYATLDKGETKGISITVLREASRRAGYEARFVELPWKRCLQAVERGKIDAVIDAAERDEFLQGPASFSVYTNTFWFRAGETVGGNLPGALKGRRIGLVAGYTYGDELESAIEAAGIVTDLASNDANNVDKLVARRVDAIIGDYVSTRLYAETNGLRLTPALPHYSVDRLFPSFNKERAAVHNDIDAALSTMIEDGTVDRIYLDALGIRFAALMP